MRARLFRISMLAGQRAYVLYPINYSTKRPQKCRAVVPGRKDNVNLASARVFRHFAMTTPHPSFQFSRQVRELELVQACRKGDLVC
jgi:hypothetical protein